MCSYLPLPQNVLFAPHLFNLVSGLEEWDERKLIHCFKIFCFRCGVCGSLNTHDLLLCLLLQPLNLHPPLASW